MRNINIHLFSPNDIVREKYNMYILFFNREDFLSVMKIYSPSFIPQYEHWYNIKIANTFYEVMIFSKEEKIYYHPMLSLRNVLTPFMQNGQPRGWFYDENGSHVRYTGIGNSLYFKSPMDTGEVSWECYKLFCDMYTQDDDIIESNLPYLSPPSPQALELYQYRFCPLSEEKKRKEEFEALRKNSNEKKNEKKGYHFSRIIVYNNIPTN